MNKIIISISLTLLAGCNSERVQPDVDEQQIIAGRVVCSLDGKAYKMTAGAGDTLFASYTPEVDKVCAPLVSEVSK